MTITNMRQLVVLTLRSGSALQQAEMGHVERAEVSGCQRTATERDTKSAGFKMKV